MKGVIGALLALVSAAAWASGMPRIELSAGMYRIDAEVASSPEQRELGLMYRQSMAPERGMLFVFDEAGTHCMWMKNTLLALSVAFLDDEGRILNIEEMAPQTEDSHCAIRPARFALEMNRGWFKQKGLKAGTKVMGLEHAPDPQ
jgi:uncharacterized membrane protein (UPF0127 family)